MANHKQGPSAAPQVTYEQCPGCPPGDSFPLARGESTCEQHAWWNYFNGAEINMIWDEE